jgi:hypothetical protein
LTEFIIQISFVLMDLLPDHLFTAADIEFRAPLFVAGSPTSYARSGIMLGHTSRYPGKTNGHVAELELAPPGFVFRPDLA